MPRYLYQASYTTEGTRGLLKDGGSQRRASIEQTLKSLGGRLEAFYYAFGETDVFAIVEVPDHATATAASLAVTASGAANVRTVVLMTAEEMDQATRKAVTYRPPGA